MVESVSWFRFLGSHQMRIINIGQESQQVYIDGAQVQCPPGTMTFTGPGGSLLEIQPTASGFTVLADGQLAENFDPAVAAASEQTVAAWWRFALPSGHSHQLRVTNLGVAGQRVFLDGQPLDAPEGTLTFTGPEATLLELQQRAEWLLLVDGVPADRFDPHADSTRFMDWSFVEGNTGTHQVRVMNIGQTSQIVMLDNQPIDAPRGEMAFTGPSGMLLQLERRGASWVLLVDGTPIERSAGSAFSDESWTFILLDGSSHQFRVLNAGAPTQQVFLDGQWMDAPPGTDAFTGPGGVLLQLNKTDIGWQLFVDGMALQDFNQRSLTTHGLGASQGRAPVIAEVDLPQGVSLNRASGMYQANARMPNKQFKLIGEFGTPQEAHAAYLATKAQLT